MNGKQNSSFCNDCIHQCCFQDFKDLTNFKSRSIAIFFVRFTSTLTIWLR